MKKIKLPHVVIVGRTNVGKSTLFNRLSENVKAIALDLEGVTRDFLRDTISWQGRSFELIDTGGISLRKTQDPILSQSRAIALSMIESADIVLFVVDGKAGLVNEDREIAQLLHKHGKTVFLVINKVDVKDAVENVYEFEGLGFTKSCFISAAHGKNIVDLLELIVEHLPVPVMVEVEEPAFKVMLLGKPNVGKSSLMNLLLQKERAIVSAEAGTTREALAERVTFYQEDIQLSDTPGVRRMRSVTEPLEGMMVQSTMQALKKSDIVLLLIDASAESVVDQELKLAFYAFDSQYKALIILFNKYDLVDEGTKVRFDHALSEYDFFLKKIITLNISCKTGKNVGKILPAVKEIWDRYSRKFNQNELTQLFKEASVRRPLYHNKNLLTFYSAHQINSAPITIVMHVNQPTWFGASQLAYFEKVLRQEYDLRGVPIKFIVRTR
ncbi:MAG TPA: ribosome biogenesis GTPase Der [Candidatus Babeliales bacterium]|jgi:GTP-binding protein|nr:ribosome biogenesis GTPase Der [Candidatus Babeliales bacterium]